ncbi:hypothetical protein HED22_03740 [Thalassospira sp. HF15]|uniref:hypothetical protein n=1 Tax=Thalassospira sp. HF15 TaxID=2722755 RepID=UPI00142F75A1|nr:hypothetical protein [Thalassospira sp. HF15]NIY74743.1 hypothetical protein [Thalassospira sp. HF15]
MQTDNNILTRRSRPTARILLRRGTRKTSYMFGLVEIFKPLPAFHRQSGICSKIEMTVRTRMIDPDGMQVRMDRLQMSAA